MPRTNKKVTEEDRIKFTQDRIKSVREFLTKVVFQQVFIPEITPYEHDSFFDQFDRTPHPWNAAWTTNRMVINYNWWYKNVDEFCTERRVKIPDIDFFYILMQMLSSMFALEQFTVSKDGNFLINLQTTI